MRTTKSLVIVVSFFLFSCGSLQVASSPEMVAARWEPWAPFAENGGGGTPDGGGPPDGGLAYYAGKVSRPRVEFHALRVDLLHPGLRIFTAGGGSASSAADGKFSSVKVSTFVRTHRLAAGINALPFDPASDKEGEPRTNVGIVISDGVMVSPPHARFDALVFYADGSAAITSQSAIESAAFIDHAVGGFYRILEGGELVPRVLDAKARRHGRHPRSAAGISPDGRYLYLLVIDGRRPGSIGGTEAETALLLRALGAGEGINFDGGGSSALALRFPDGKVRVVNTPTHDNIPGRERAVAGCLGVALGVDIKRED